MIQYFLSKLPMRMLFLLLIGMFTVNDLIGQTVVNHNISGGSLVIQGTDLNDYLVTGTTSTNRIIVGAGYNGTITLRNVSMSIPTNTTATFAAACGNGTNVVTTGSCIAIMGQNRASALAPAPNLAPVTRVNLVLDGQNEISYFGNREYCAIQVDEGAQIEIGAIDPNDNSSGVLVAKSTNYVPGSGSIAQSGAGIGAIGTNGYNGYQGYSVISGTGGCATASGRTTGGNIIISSGTITVWGGHAAGIGGAHYDYYNGIVVIYGGIIVTRANFDAAGIGSGCPLGTGIIGCYADNSTIIVLPPAQITAFGAGANATGGVGTTQQATLGLAGTENISYINDPNKSKITVRTSDYEPNADIYLDLTENTNLVDIFNTLGIELDLSKVRVGRTNSSGIFEFNAELQETTTFFTDASSTRPATVGRPYLPVDTTITGNSNNHVEVILPLLGAEISFTDHLSSPLELGYTATEAFTNAFRVEVSYSDALTMSDVTFALQDGGGSHFVDLQFFAADGVTPIPAPTTLTGGTTFYITVQLKQGKPVGVYNDVLLVGGSYDGIPLPGYIRRVGMQRVVVNDSNDNNHIKVTASPNKFTVAYPTTSTVDLTLNIDHTGTSVVYDMLDVTAKYLVTPIADYDAALAANPISSSSWVSMNIPIANGVNEVTTVDFSGKSAGTYYIHWYVESGVLYAHSLTVTDPPRTYGGFGPYVLGLPEITLSLDKTNIDEGGGAATGMATLTARLDGGMVAPTGGITIPLTYGGTAVRGAGYDYTADAGITILGGGNSAAISLTALADYILEGSETVTITAPTTVTVSSVPYTILGIPLNITIADKTDGTIEVVKQTPVTGEASEPSTHGSFRIKYKDSNVTRTSATKVLYTISGDPASSNYTVSPTPVGEATIPAGVNHVDVHINVVNNNRVEGERTVTIEITELL